MDGLSDDSTDDDEEIKRQRSTYLKSPAAKTKDNSSAEAKKNEEAADDENVKPDQARGVKRQHKDENKTDAERKSTKKKEAEEEMQQKKMTEQKSQQLLSARMKTIVGIRWPRECKKNGKGNNDRGTYRNRRGLPGLHVIEFLIAWSAEPVITVKKPKPPLISSVGLWRITAPILPFSVRATLLMNSSTKSERKW
uniref:Uncharacterized protein n=1 Tax=Ditylenchus dipsaci TaxID=166011 RepID=A0A915DBJ3_9BILA